MKIYGEGVFDNERADTVGISYIEFSKGQIEENIAWLADTNDTCQCVLGFLHILLDIGELFPNDLTSRVKQSEVDRWKDVFDAWYERVKKKIPTTYRETIRSDADRLFTDLRAKATSLEWL